MINDPFTIKTLKGAFILLFVVFSITTFQLMRNNIGLTKVNILLEKILLLQDTKISLTDELLEIQTTLLLHEKSSNPQEQENNSFSLTGVASYYDYVLKSGWSSKGHYVCATRDFKRHSKVLVTNLDNNKSVECLVTDYGPDESIFPERIIDLSSTAFKSLAPLRQGIIKNIKVKQL